MASLNTTLSVSLTITCLLAMLIKQTSGQAAGTMYLSNTTDESALLSFKSLVHDPYNSLSSWAPNVSFCTWKGVWCSSRRQRVVELNLTEMALEGTLSPRIANLSFLRVLSLRNNSFHGNLLSFDFGRLVRLRVLRLSMNQLEGPIPQSLSHCLNLQSLILSFNKFTGSIPAWLGSLPNLSVLNLGFNSLTGAIPPTLGNLSNLETLMLFQNGLQGEIPYELGSIAGMQTLNLGWNFYETTVPSSIFNISSLRSLTLTYSRLFGTLPQKIGQTLPNLEELFLATNNFSGQIPASLSNASMLRTIEIGVNSFDGPVPTELGNLPNLQILKIWNTNVTNVPGESEVSLLTSLTKCRLLQTLVLSQNQLTGIIPASVGNLSTNLQFLDLSANQLQGSIPSGIANLTALINLFLDNNDLNGGLPENIGQLKNLQKLWFLGNMLEGSIPSQLYGLENLGELYLSQNRFSGSISDSIQNLSNLVVLKLGSNNLSSMIPSSLWSLKNLQTVDLSQNSLTGSLPTEIGSLNSLYDLDISANKLSGSLPVTLSKLQMLQNLNLSWNSLQGIIPQPFDNLVALETLDLSHNFINGRIPESLESLKYLRFLNLSFNRLEGEIPSGGIFAKLNADSFEGNYALCGPPKFHVPVCSARSKRKPNDRIIIIGIVGGFIVVIILCVLVLLLCRRKRTMKQVPADDSPRIGHRMISYMELLRATNSFSESNLLGNGSIGTVYKGTLQDGTIVAVKVLNMQVEEANKSFDAECEVLRKVKHRNLVKIISSCSNLDFKALIFEYMPSGNLDSWLFSSSGCSLSLLQRVDIMVDIACAIEYLHHDHPEPIVHCDLKPNNILLDDNMTAHVADFGVAKMLLGNKSSTLTSALGTMGYIAPEFGLAGKVTTKVDVYSFGILLLETFTRKKPTDATFGGDLSLRKWVAAAFPDQMSSIIDDCLLTAENNNDRGGTEHSSMKMHEIFVSIIEIGLSCSRESPEERITMREVAAALKKVRNNCSCLTGQVVPSTAPERQVV